MRNAFLDKFFLHVRKKNVQVALSDGNEFFTWKDYEYLSGKVYAYIKDKGIAPEQFVGIQLSRGLEQLICQMGVLRSGAAYVSLDTDSVPEERAQKIIADSHCTLVIDNAAWEEIKFYRYESGYNKKVNDHQLAFALYTSGSTGNPKGVLHERGDLMQCSKSADWKGLSLVREKDTFAILIPLSMAAAFIWFIKATYEGAKILLVPRSYVLQSNSLIPFLDKNHATVTFAPPFLVSLLENSKNLKRIFVGGETANHLDAKKNPVYHMYASSESLFVLNALPIKKNKAIPTLGIPKASRQVQIIHGELCFYNPFFRGYLNNFEATKNAFIEISHARLYRSHDAAKWDENGELVILGRLDDMFKVNGNRVEPAEVEAAFQEICPGSEAVLRKFEIHDRDITVLFYTVPNDSALEQANVWKEKMRSQLPQYMVPHFFFQIKNFPRFSNGKIDRRSLQCPNFWELRPIYSAPETSLQKEVANAFESSLEIQNAGLDDDFFLLGGDSISSMELMLLLEKYDLTPKDIEEGKTVAGIASILQKRTVSTADIFKVKSEYAYPLLPTQKHMLLQQLNTSETSPLSIHTWVPISTDVDLNRLCLAIDTAIQAHPACLFIFEKDPDYRQVFAPELFQKTQIQNCTEEALSKKLSQFFRKRSIFSERLIFISLFKTEKRAVLAISLNHAMIDGSSFSLFLLEIERIYHGEIPAKDSYVDALVEYDQYIHSEQGKLDWLTMQSKEVQIFESYATIPKPDYDEMWGASAKTNAIEIESFLYNSTEIYAFIYAQTVRDFNENNRVAFVVTHHGKVTEKQRNCCGNFATDILIALDFTEKKQAELLSDIQQQISDSLTKPYRPILPAMSAVIYQSNVLEMKLFGENAADFYVNSNFEISENALNVHVYKDNGKFNLMLEYDSARFKAESMNHFAKMFQQNAKLFKQQEHL